MYREIIEAFMEDATPHPAISILAFLSGVYPDRPKPHPINSEEFGACIKLLKNSDECRSRFNEMRKASLYWASLVDHWDELQNLYEKEKKEEIAFPTLRDRLSELNLI